MNRIHLALVMGVISISLAAPLFKLSAPTHPLVASAFRLTLAGFLWTFWLLVKTKPTVSEMKSMAYVGGIGAFCYSIHFGSWVWSLHLTSTAASVTLVTTTPLLLGLIGWWTQKDAPTSSIWIGLSVASFGIVLLSPLPKVTTLTVVGLGSG